MRTMTLVSTREAVKQCTADSGEHTDTDEAPGIGSSNWSVCLSTDHALQTSQTLSRSPVTDIVALVYS